MCMSSKARTTGAFPAARAEAIRSGACASQSAPLAGTATPARRRAAASSRQKWSAQSYSSNVSQATGSRLRRDASHWARATVFPVPGAPDTRVIVSRCTPLSMSLLILGRATIQSGISGGDVLAATNGAERSAVRALSWPPSISEVMRSPRNQALAGRLPAHLKLTGIVRWQCNESMIPREPRILPGLTVLCAAAATGRRKAAGHMPLNGDGGPILRDLDPHHRKNSVVIARIRGAARAMPRLPRLPAAGPMCLNGRIDGSYLRCFRAVQSRLELGFAFLRQRGLQHGPAVLAHRLDRLVRRHFLHHEEERGRPRLDQVADLVLKFLVDSRFGDLSHQGAQPGPDRDPEDRDEEQQAEQQAPEHAPRGACPDRVMSGLDVVSALPVPHDGRDRIRLDDEVPGEGAGLIGGERRGGLVRIADDDQVGHGFSSPCLACP